MVQSSLRRRYTFTSPKDTVTFGQYKDRTLEEILDLDPQYLVWLDDVEIAFLPEELLIRAYDALFRDVHDEDWFLGLLDLIDGE